MAGHFLGGSPHSIFGTDDFLVSEINERVLVGGSSEDDISTSTSISAERTAVGDVFFTSPRNRPVASATGFAFDYYLIYEHAREGTHKTEKLKCNSSEHEIRKTICQKKLFRYTAGRPIISTMAKGKRTYMSCISTESGIMGYITNIQKKNFAAGEKLELRKYDKKLRKHVIFKLKETKN